MIHLTLDEVIELHDDVIAQSGGTPGVRDPGALNPAVAQPRMTFGGEDLYPTLVEKAAALAFSLIKNHAFIDGNKRIGHLAMETFLGLNGSMISADVDEQESVFLRLAASEIGRDAFAAWIAAHRVDDPRTTHHG